MMDEITKRRLVKEGLTEADISMVEEMAERTRKSSGVGGHSKMNMKQVGDGFIPTTDEEGNCLGCGHNHIKEREDEARQNREDTILLEMLADGTVSITSYIASHGDDVLKIRLLNLIDKLSMRLQQFQEVAGKYQMLAQITRTLDSMITDTNVQSFDVSVAVNEVVDDIEDDFEG